MGNRTLKKPFTVLISAVCWKNRFWVTTFWVMAGLSSPSRHTVSRQSCGLCSLETEEKERKALAAVKAVVVAIVYLQLKLKEVVVYCRIFGDADFGEVNTSLCTTLSRYHTWAGCYKLQSRVLVLGPLYSALFTWAVNLDRRRSSEGS